MIPAITVPDSKTEEPTIEGLYYIEGAPDIYIVGKLKNINLVDCIDMCKVSYNDGILYSYEKMNFNQFKEHGFTRYKPGTTLTLTQE